LTLIPHCHVWQSKLTIKALVVDVGQKSSLSGSKAAVKCPKIGQKIMQHKIRNVFSV
jgi:hypothetical protein